jgi:hypothetical protein
MFSTMHTMPLCWQTDFWYILYVRLLGCRVFEYVCSIQEFVTELFTL